MNNGVGQRQLYPYQVSGGFPSYSPYIGFRVFRQDQNIPYFATVQGTITATQWAQEIVGVGTSFPTYAPFAGYIFIRTDQNYNAYCATVQGTITSAQWSPLLAGNYNELNYLHNPSFTTAQKGTNFSSVGGGAYTLDRWIGGTDGGTLAVSQQALAAGSGVFGEPNYSAQIQKTASGGTTNLFYQRIENAQTLSNQTVSVSFWAKAASALTVSVNFTQNFNSASGSATTSSQSFSITTSWQRFTGTFALPSVSGKTITEPGSYLQLTFAVAGSATFTLNLAQVQLEEGNIATPFKARNQAQELLICQRYYWKTAATGTVPTAGTATGRVLFPYATNGSSGFASVMLPVPMRTTPTLSFLNPNTAASNAVYNYTRSNASASVPTNSTSSNQIIEFSFTPGTGWAVGDLLGIILTADATL